MDAAECILSVQTRDRRRCAWLLCAAAAASMLMCGCLSERAAATKTSPHILLRIHGSAAVGAELMPALAAEYLSGLGADSVHIVNGADPAVRTVVGLLAGRREVIEIRAGGALASLEELNSGRCDIAMSLSGVVSSGSPRSTGREHEIGLDGIVAIVNKANPLTRIDLSRLAAVCSRRAKTWRELRRGSNAAIRLYTADTSRVAAAAAGVLAPDSLWLAAAATAAPDARYVAGRVAVDPAGIGLVDLASVSGCKTLAISNKESRAFEPTKFNIAVEDYPLTRRLLLQTPAQPALPAIADFISFIKSPQGQEVVEASGYVSNVLRLAAPSAGVFPYALRAVAGNALQLSLTFRFEDSGVKLTDRSASDIARLAAFIDKEQLSSCKLLLLGFTDSRYGYQRTIALSAARAKVVEDSLKLRANARFIESAGFGDLLPVSTNTTREGRQRNGRVEVWVSCGPES